MSWLLHFFHRLIFRHWRWTWLAALAISLASLCALPYIRLETSRSEMSRGNEAEEAYQAIAREFGLTNTIILLAEGKTPDLAAQALLSLCQKLEAKGHAFGQLFCRLDHPYLLNNGLYLMPEKDFAQLRKELSGLVPVLATYQKQPGLPGAVSALDRLLSSSASEGAKAEELQKLGQFLSSLEQAAGGTPQALSRFFGQLVEPAAAQRVRLAKDGSFAFGLFFPASDRTDTAYILPLMQEIQKESRAATAAFPETKILLGGEPAVIAEEMTAIDRDNLRLSLLSFLGVAALFLLAYRGHLRRALWILTCLALGVLWSFGWVKLLYGRLNLVSSVFVIILIGLGIDYGIFWLGKFEEEEAKGQPQEGAASTTYLTTGRGIVAGALATIAVFGAIGLSPYRGFSELGWISAGSMGLCLLLMTVLFPGGVVRLSRPSRKKPDPLQSLGRGLQRVSCVALSWPKAVLLISLLLLVPCLFFGRHLRFEHNILTLLPQEASSSRTLQLLETRSDFRIDQALFSLPDWKTLQAVDRQLRAHPLVLDTESVLNLLPRDPAGRQASLLALSRQLPEGNSAPAPLTKRPLLRQCRLLHGKTEGIGEALFSSGMPDLLAAAAAVETATGRLCQTIERTPAATLGKNSRAIAAAISLELSKLQHTLRQPPPTLAQIPPALRARLVSPSGRYLLAASPQGSLWDKAFLLRFVAAMKGVDPQVSGFPVQFLSLTGEIFRGFAIASFLSVLAVFLFVMLDFFSLAWGLVCLLPLAMGIGWTIGLMALLRMPFNLVNIIALPLIAGMGLDSTLQMTHAMHDAKKDKRLSIGVAGRNSFLSAATIILCLGLLAFSSHRGMASLGLLISLGLTMILLAAILLVPALAKAAGLWHPEATAEQKKK